MSEIPAEDSFFDFKCPYCGQVNSFPNDATHTLQECASCAESIVVPAPGVETGGKLPLPIRTPRLVLRRFHPEDSAKLLEIVAQDESGKLFVTEANVEQFIEQQREARFPRIESDIGVYLAVELAEGRELAGYGLVYYSGKDHNDAAFSVSISAPRRRQGLGLEATRALLDFAFHGLCVRRVAVSCPSKDAAARRMLEKAGLRQEGEFVKSWFNGEEWVNIASFALLKEECSPS
jgi:RimJ/RimL family protein N-acetyltransferase